MQMSSCAVLHSNEYALFNLHEPPTVNSFSLSLFFPVNTNISLHFSTPLCLFQHWTYSIIPKQPGSPSTFWFLSSFSIFYSPGTSYSLLSSLCLSPQHFLPAILFYLPSVLTLPLHFCGIWSSTVRQKRAI